VVNEFPLQNLRVLSVESGDEATVVTATVNVLRHSTDPRTFAPTDLVFGVTDAASGTEIPSSSHILRTTPDPSLAEVSFQTELLAPNLADRHRADITETELELTVSLGSKQAQTRFMLQ